MKQKFRKTPESRRKDYRYFDANDRCVVVIRPNEDLNITAVHIKLLHSLDDAEVYNNCKNCSSAPAPIKSDAEKNSGEKASSHWVLSLEFIQELADKGVKDERNLLVQAYRSEAQRRHDIRKELLHDAVTYLTPSQQLLFRQYYMEEMTQKEIAQLEKVSNVAIHKRLKKMEEELKEIIFKKILSDG